MKVFINTLSLVSFIITISTAAADGPGATVSFDLAALEEARDVYFSYVENTLKEVTMPDIDFKQGRAVQNIFKVLEPAANVQVAADPSSNALVISANNMTAQFLSKDFRYKLSILTAKGSMAADVIHVSINAIVGLTTQTLPNGKVVPAFTVPNVTVDLPKEHISIHIRGNIVAKIADAFKVLFVSTVRDQITAHLSERVKMALPPILNDIAAKQNGQSDLFEGLTLDWSLAADPIVAAKSFQFGINGLFHPTNETAAEFVVPIEYD